MPRKRPELNKREKAILKFIEKQIMSQGYPPSVREIGKAVGLSSTATVHGYLAKLEDKGYIKKQDKKGRTLRLLKGADNTPKKKEDKSFYTGKEMVDVPFGKPWALCKITLQDGYFIHENQHSFFEEDGGQKYFTLAMGREWNGGEGYDDLC